MNVDRKARIREYRDTPRPMGVFRVHNTVNGKSLIGSSTDLNGMLNRQRAQLKMGAHPDRQMQADWKESGPDAFVFEVLDTLEPRDEPGNDPAADLAALEKLWLDKLAPDGDPGYKRARS
jgi:environmental stress-induced protein Ves